MRSIVRSIRAVLLIGVFASTVRADFSYPNFSAPQNLNLVGAAAITGSQLVLVPSSTYNAGAAWHSVKQFVAGGFDTTFQFSMPKVAGADGFAFVIQNDNANALGLCGGSMGYSSGTSTGCLQGTNVDIANALVVEFDVWSNSEYFDPSANHVSVHAKLGPGELCNHANSLGSVDPTFDLNDGVTRTCRIRHDGGTLLEVFVGSLTTPILTVNVNLASLGLDNGSGWVGFTAATGGAATDARIRTWSFDNCPGTVAPYGIGCPGAGGVVPEIDVLGCPESNGTITFSIAKGLGGSTALLFFGLMQGSVPIGVGGCTLLITPVLGPTLALPLSGSGPGQGGLVLPSVLPNGLTGLSITMQVFVIDAVSPIGASASNGLELTFG